MDDLYKEYNKYLSNIKETTINDQKTKINNPIIRYLFLENVLNNLKNIAKFINLQNKEIEQNVEYENFKKSSLISLDSMLSKNESNKEDKYYLPQTTP